MMHIEEYCRINNITRRWVKELINRNQISSEKINGKRYIICPPPVNSTDTSNLLPPDKFKAEIRTYVQRAGKLYIKTALKRISEYELATGTKICGLSGRTLYGIAEGKRAVYHRKRKDTGKARNSNLAAAREKIEAIAGHWFIKLGEKNPRYITTLLQERASHYKSLYQLVAIPHPKHFRYVINYTS